MSILLRLKGIRDENRDLSFMVPERAHIKSLVGVDDPLVAFSVSPSSNVLSTITSLSTSSMVFLAHDKILFSSARTIFVEEQNSAPSP